MHWMQYEQPGLIPAHHILVVFHVLPMSYPDVQGDFHFVSLGDTRRRILMHKVYICSSLATKQL